jgi:hypothetical protein
VHSHLGGHVGKAAHGGDSARGQDHVDVHALDVEVLHACVRIEADPVAGERRSLPADVPRRAAVPHLPVDSRVEIDAIARTQPTIQVGALADAPAREAVLTRRLSDERAERVEPGLAGGGEIALDRLDGFDDVGVGVEDAIAVLGQRSASMAGRA